MAGRPVKAGLDYFELDCQLEDKIKLIQTEFGLKGFAIIVKLYQKIYGGFGYYCEWSEDSLLLFMLENGVQGCSEKNLISEVVAACIRRDIFSERIYKEFGVLTSVGVQKRYLNAVSRRDSVNLIKEYLLVGVPKNRNNVIINSINADINSINECRNSQSREDKIKEDKSNLYSIAKYIDIEQEAQPLARPETISNISLGDTYQQIYEDLVTKYGKEFVDFRIKKAEEYGGIGKIGIRKIAKWCEADAKSQLEYSGSNGSTRKTKNAFNQFEQRDYDANQLERELLKKGIANNE